MKLLLLTRCDFPLCAGETIDTLMALQYCKSRSALVLGITNSVGSSVGRESHCGIHVNAGPEIGVASTKAYTSQFTSLLLFAIVLSQDRVSAGPRRKQVRHFELNEAPLTLANFSREVLN